MASTIGSNLLKYLGLVGGSGAQTGLLVPRASTSVVNQMLFRDFDEAGAVADPDIWTKYNSMMKRPVTFDSMLQLWEEMADWDLMHAALVEIVDEATQVDQNSPASVWFQCNDKEFEDTLNELLVTLDVETIVRSQVWHVAALGNHFEKIEYAPQEGVLGLSFVHPMDMRRYWLERNRKCIGFKWAGHAPDKEPVFVGPDNQTPVERLALSSGKNIEELWYPWDFMHMRRMYRLRVSEHGEPLFAEAEGIYKKLRLAVDQMVVHRAQVQPDRYSINIDVQEQPPAEQMKTVQRWKQQLRSKLAFGQQGTPNTLNSASDFSSYYNAWALDTILYVAQPKGYNHVVTKIPGTTQVPDVYDIELLTDLFYSIIGMPRSWFGGQKDQQNAPSGKALLAQDIRFLRKIKGIRQPLIQAYTWLGYFHAVLRGKDIRQLDIKVLMPPVGSLEEQMKLEMLKIQTEVLSALADVMEKYRLPREAWVETIFKRYLHLPDDVINIFITALPSPSEGDDVTQKAESQAPVVGKLLNEIAEVTRSNPRLQRLIGQLKTAHFGENFTEVNRNQFRPYKKPADVLLRPPLKEADVIINSLGGHPFELRTEASKGRRVGMPLQEQLDAKRKNSEEPSEELSEKVNGGTDKNRTAYRRFLPDRF